MRRVLALSNQYLQLPNSKSKILIIFKRTAYGSALFPLLISFLFTLLCDCASPVMNSRVRSDSVCDMPFCNPKMDLISGGGVEFNN